MNWKNLIENIVLISVMFLGLGIYTQMVLKPIVLESIRQETTKIETSVNNKIDNKFKKIENLDAALPLLQSLPSTIQQTNTVIGSDSICLPIENLTRRQKRRLGID